MTGVQLPVVPGLPQPGRPLVIGVVNVTPDSFSDGGRWYEPEAAVRHGLQLLADGADILEVGGESTRPGAERPTPQEERRRVLPVITGLVAASAVVSIDTIRADVAADAVAAGAAVVNDVSGGMADPDMLGTAADSGVAYVAMHWRGHSVDMQSRAVYADVVSEVAAELSRQVALVLASGVSVERLILDPGIGFAKTAEHNWELLAGLQRILDLGQPVLVGASRKAFLGLLLPGADGQPRPAGQRDDASAALTALLATTGVWAVRTHTVTQHRDAIEVALRLGQEQRLAQQQQRLRAPDRLPGSDRVADKEVDR